MTRTRMLFILLAPIWLIGWLLADESTRKRFRYAIAETTRRNGGAP